MMRQVDELVRSDPDLERELYVRESDGGKTFVADLRIYTKNRIFRTVYSHKRNTDRTLVPHGKNAAPSFDVFTKHLVTRPRSSDIVIMKHTEKDGSEPFSTSKIGTASIRKRPSERTDERKIPRRDVGTGPNQLVVDIADEITRERKYSSPDPWSYTVFSGDTLVMSGTTTECIFKGAGETKGGEKPVPSSHNNNHSYWVVYLRSGMYFQKCHSTHGRCGMKQVPDMRFNGWYLSPPLTERCGRFARGAEETSERQHELPYDVPCSKDDFTFSLSVL
jgi:hypothetical protein